jgi:molybdopterin-guanine dinucleotide biosynthesis protein A
MQPVFALLRRDLLPSLLEYLELGERKIDRWFDKHRLALAYFEDRHDMFINVNDADERAAVEARLAGVSA